MLANGVVGGLALFSLILMTTVVVFGIKFVLDRNLAENAGRSQEDKPAADPPAEKKAEPEVRPLYMIKQPAAQRRRKPARPAAQYAVLQEGAVYTLEPVKKKKEKESAAS